MSKIRNGFVSNSSSSSFVVEHSELDKFDYSPDYSSISFEEFCDEYLAECLFGGYAEYDKVKVVDDNEFMDSFENCVGSYTNCVPKSAETEFRNYVKAEYGDYRDKDFVSNLQKATKDFVNKVYDILKYRYDKLDLVHFDASDHDSSPDGYKDNDESYWRDVVYDASGFVKIFNRH